MLFCLPSLRSRVINCKHHHFTVFASAFTSVDDASCGGVWSEVMKTHLPLCGRLTLRRPASLNDTPSGALKKLPPRVGGFLHPFLFLIQLWGSDMHLTLCIVSTGFTVNNYFHPRLFTPRALPSSALRRRGASKGRRMARIAANTMKRWKLLCHVNAFSISSERSAGRRVG